MTPQERQLVADLFDRLAALENEPRDPDAERLIREGLAKAPHAIYALVQSVLVQDEALKQADAHIQDLEAALQQPAPGAGGQRGFLDNMRDAVFGQREAGQGTRGSVPSVRPGDQPMGVPPQYRQEAGSPWGGAGQGAQGSAWGGGAPAPQGSAWGGAPQAGAPMPQQSGGGGSFLGTAAAVAAGAIGGGLLASGIRNMLGGHQQHGPFSGAFDQIAGSGSRDNLASGSGGGDLARQAGLDDIRGGGQGRAGLFGGDDEDRNADRSAGLYETAENDTDDDDADYDGDYEDDGGDDIQQA
jgi:uncharacterized protein